MAQRPPGGETPAFGGDVHRHDPYLVGGKRRVSHSEGSDGPYGHMPPCKRPRRLECDHDRYHVETHVQTVPVNKIAFIIIRERSPTPEVGAGGCHVHDAPMERTASGLSISSDSSYESTSHHDDFGLVDDLEAARRVREHLAAFSRRSPDSQHERILKALIQPKAREAEFLLDNDALESIFSAANEIFFYNSLSQRVTWDWSHSSSRQYVSRVIGTTAVRRAQRGGFETLIVLSQPILKGGRYNRRLLISTFLHEMIHSYLFIRCGFKARHCGGHTVGFRQIASLIDDWAGPDNLHLRDIEADLGRFRDEPLRGREQRHQGTFHHNDYCSQPPGHGQYRHRHTRWDDWIDDQWGDAPQSRSISNAIGSPYVYRQGWI